MFQLLNFLDGGGSKVALGRCRGHCRWVWTIRRSDFSTWDKNCTCPLSYISKWIGTTSTTTSKTPSAAPITVPTAALTETATANRGRKVQRLDEGCISRCWHSRLLICRHRCAVRLYTPAGFATCVGRALLFNDKFCMCNYIAV
jgi:hypothetical protein